MCISSPALSAPLSSPVPSSPALPVRRSPGIAKVDGVIIYFIHGKPSDLKGELLDLQTFLRKWNADKIVPCLLLCNPVGVLIGAPTATTGYCEYKPSLAPFTNPCPPPCPPSHHHVRPVTFFPDAILITT